VTERHKAPRRRVAGVSHVSGYGATWWLHRLECGHVERRKRKAPAPSIGCTACRQQMLTQAQTFIELSRLPNDEVGRGDDASVELEAQRLAAEVASRLRIQPELVQVHVSPTINGLVIDGATVWLPRVNALALLDAAR